jgi:hypothetical protein
MPTIGTDCHLTITHPDVNSGAAYGFILQAEDKNYGPAVSVQRQLNVDESINVKMFFTIILADNLITADGSYSTLTRADMYAKLHEYLTKPSGLIITTSVGVYTDIGAGGFSATEVHFGGLSLVTLQLTNTGAYFPPAPSDAYFGSVWDGTVYFWDTSYWRDL